MNKRFYVAISLLIFCFLSSQPLKDKINKTVSLSKEVAKRKAINSLQLYNYLNRDTRVMENYDVLNYFISLEFDFDNESISGFNEVGVEILENNVSEIVLELSQYMNVGQIMIDGQVQAYSHQNRFLTVSTDQSYNQGDEIVIRIEYSGIPHSSNGFGGGFGYLDHDGVPIAFSCTEPCGSPEWYPCKDVPADKADDVWMWITCPEDYVVSGNGLLENIVNNGNGTKTYKWHESYPISTYLISVACTNYQIETLTYTHENGTMPVQNFLYPEQFDCQSEALQDICQMIDFLTTIYGPYPFLDEKYGHSAVPELGGAMEHQTCTTMGDVILTPDFYSIVLHELSHQWVGDLITCGTWQHIWLNEGFATYSEGLYSEHLFGAEGYHDYMNSLDSGDDLNDKLWRDDDQIPEEVLNWVVYAKGAWVLHMLRGIVGDENFFNIVSAYLSDEDLRYGNAVTQDLAEIAHEITGTNLDWFFNEWLYQEGRPDYKYCVYKNDNNQLKVSVISQSQFAETFDMFLPLKINDQVHTLWAEGGCNAYDIEVGSEIESIEWDPDNFVLDNGYEEMIPVILDFSTLRDNAVFLMFERFNDELCYGFHVYRSTNGSEYEKINEAPVTEYYWIDNDVTVGQEYSYKIKAVADEDGEYVSQFSDAVTFSPVNYSFNQGILLVDMTRDYAAGNPLPTDEEVDQFYSDIFSNYNCTNWDVLANGLPAISDLAAYSTVILYCDDITTIPFNNQLGTLVSYLEAGGNLFISAWKMLYELNDELRRDYLGISEIDYSMNIDFCGAFGTGAYPDLSIDPDKVELEIWNDNLQLVSSIIPINNAETIYTYNSSTNDQNWEGASCAIKQSGNGELVILGFPLYFIETAAAGEFVAIVMNEFGEEVGIHESEVTVKSSLTNFPNPFNPVTEISYSLDSESDVVLDIFNVKGQKVKTLVNSRQEAGEYKFIWNGRDENDLNVSSGVYLSKLNTGKTTISRKMMLIK